MIATDWAVFRGIYEQLAGGPAFWPNTRFEPPDHVSRSDPSYPSTWWWCEPEYDDAERLTMRGKDARRGELVLALFVQPGAGDYAAGDLLDQARAIVAAASVDHCQFLAAVPEFYGTQKIKRDEELATDWAAWGLRIPFIAQDQ